jgi:hypothetical protein
LREVGAATHLIRGYVHGVALQVDLQAPVPEDRVVKDRVVDAAQSHGHSVRAIIGNIVAIGVDCAADGVIAGAILDLHSIIETVYDRIALHVVRLTLPARDGDAREVARNIVYVRPRAADGVARGAVNGDARDGIAEIRLRIALEIRPDPIAQDGIAGGILGTEVADRDADRIGRNNIAKTSQGVKGALNNKIPKLALTRSCVFGDVLGYAGCTSR